MTDIDELLAKLNPKTAAAFRTATTIENRLLPTPSLGINMAIGGIGYGRQTTLWGNRSGGKTLFALQTAANAQKDDQGVAWIDAEKNFDPAWARRNGLDTDQVAVSKITSIADMADAAFDLIKAGFGFIAVDSISTLLPQSFFDDKGNMKDLADTGQIGTFSKNLTTALNMLNRENTDAALVLISQIRNQIGSYGASVGPMGGLGLQHLNSTQIKLWSNPNVKEAILGDVSVGDLIFKRPIGRPVTWTIEKNRGPGMNASDSYDLYFAGSHVGVDRVGEVLDFGVQYGVAEKGGAWYTVEGERLQGRAKAVEFLRANPDIEQKMYDAILEKSKL
jgi:recombination protein RecA